MLKKTVHVADATRVDQSSIVLFGLVLVIDTPSTGISPQLKFVTRCKSGEKKMKNVDIRFDSEQPVDSFESLDNITHFFDQRLSNLFRHRKTIVQNKLEKILLQKLRSMLIDRLKDREMSHQEIDPFELTRSCCLDLFNKL